MLKLPPVSRTDEGVEQIKVFLRAEEREQLRNACQLANIPMTYVARQLLVAWSLQIQDENQNSKSL